MNHVETFKASEIKANSPLGQVYAAQKGKDASPFSGMFTLPHPVTWTQIAAAQPDNERIRLEYTTGKGTSKGAEGKKTDAQPLQASRTRVRNESPKR